MPILTGHGGGPTKSNLHPGNDYYVNIFTGTIQRISNRLIAAGLEHSTPGWEGPYDWPTAQAMVAGSKAGFGAVGLPVLGPGGGLGLVKGASSDLGGINAIGDFFNRLTEANTWLRVGEFVAGALLVYLGLSATMKGTEAQSVTQGVTKPVKKGVGLLPPVRDAKIARSATKRVARERRVTEKSKQIRAADRAKKAKAST